MRKAGWVVVAGLALGGTFARADEQEDDPKAVRSLNGQNELGLAKSAVAVAPVVAVASAVATAPAEGETAVGGDNGTNVAPGTSGDTGNTLVMSGPKKVRHRHFGVGFNVGAPDIMVIEAIGRPVDWLRLHAGLGTDLVNVGIMGGVTFVPLNRKVSPSATVEGGKMFEGNASWLASAFGVSNSDVFKKIGYEYCNLHLGIELGSPNRFQFYIHGGYSYIAATVHNVSTAATSTQAAVTITDPNLSLWSPSGKIGFVLYL